MCQGNISVEEAFNTVGMMGDTPTACEAINAMSASNSQYIRVLSSLGRMLGCGDGQNMNQPPEVGQQNNPSPVQNEIVDPV